MHNAFVRVMQQPKRLKWLLLRTRGNCLCQSSEEQRLCRERVESIAKLLTMVPEIMCRASGLPMFEVKFFVRCMT